MNMQTSQVKKKEQTNWKWNIFLWIVKEKRTIEIEGYYWVFFDDDESIDSLEKYLGAMSSPWSYSSLKVSMSGLLYVYRGSSE